jgi:hypothetical protein
VIAEPERAEVNVLVKSVCFSNEEIKAILHTCNLVPEDLTPFIYRESEHLSRDCSSNNNPVMTRPLFQTKTGIVVATPTSLCFALRAFLWNEIKQSKHQVQIANALADVQLFDIEKLFDVAGYKLIDPAFVENFGQLRELFFKIDNDKIVLVHILIGFEAFGNSGVSDSDYSKWIEKRRAIVGGKFGKEYKLLNLVLFVTSGIGHFSFPTLKVPMKKLLYRPRLTCCWRLAKSILTVLIYGNFLD